MPDLESNKNVINDPMVRPHNFGSPQMTDLNHENPTEEFFFGLFEGVTKLLPEWLQSIFINYFRFISQEQYDADNNELNSPL